MRYKGFTCLIEPNYFFEQGTIAYGKKEGDLFYQSPLVQEAINRLGKMLNLRAHSVKGRVSQESTNGEIYLSQRVQVSCFPKLGFEDLVIQANERFQLELSKLKMTASKNL